MKKRHVKRRLVTEEFVEEMANHLPNGTPIYVQTDVEELFAYMVEIFEMSRFYNFGVLHDNPLGIPTDREKFVFNEEGDIYRVKFIVGRTEEMVFRFTEDNDKKLVREAIAQKPFAAKYRESSRMCAHVAERVSNAIQEVVAEKQTLDAINEQSHYETLAGLVRQYVLLEGAFTDDKKDRINKKKAGEACASRCASKIVKEAMARRSLRGD
ncbi:TRNA (guanine-N(7)-)-methyltransferase, partial [Phytophthora megakarya]